MQPWRGSAATGVLAASLLALLLTAPGGAQQVDRPRVGIGYVAAAPDLLAGGAAYVLLPALGGIGVYVDAKLDASSPTHKSNFEPGLTAQQAESQYGDEYGFSTDSWRAFDVALVRPVRPALSVYAGGGYAQRKRYSEYYDPSATRGLVGHYWVEDPTQRKGTLNIMAGMMFRMSRFLNAQMGVESAPGSFTVGVSVLLPPR